MLTRVNSLKKATVSLISVAFFFSSLSFAETKTETYKDVMEKAYNLSLQRDRTQAVSILLGALKRESKKGRTPKELQTALSQVSHIFYAEKAQQTYELALSFLQTDTALAMSKLQEAARLEPENLSIELSIARVQIMQNDCDAAQKTLNRNKEQALYLEEVQLAQAQAAVCMGQFETYLSLKPKDLKKTSMQVYWLSLDAEYQYKVGAFNKVKELATNIQSLEKSFVEASYWDWKAARELKTKADNSAQKYLSQCKSISTRLQRQFQAEPNLCRRTAEVETFLKKNNNSEI